MENDKNEYTWYCIHDMSQDREILRFENLYKEKKAMGRHGVIKWVFEKEKIDFGPKDPGLICRLAGVQGGNFETVGR